MSEKKTLKRTRTNTFTGFSGALMSTSAGQFIQSITYTENANGQNNTGYVVFEKDVPNSFMNFCINYENDYGDKTYIRLTAPKIIDCDNKILSKDQAYKFKFSQVWEKKYDKTNHMISERYGWQ